MLICHGRRAPVGREAAAQRGAGASGVEWERGPGLARGRRTGRELEGGSGRKQDVEHLAECALADRSCIGRRSECAPRSVRPTRRPRFRSQGFGDDGVGGERQEGLEDVWAELEKIVAGWSSEEVSRGAPPWHESRRWNADGLTTTDHIANLLYCLCRRALHGCEAVRVDATARNELSSQPVSAQSSLAARSSHLSQRSYPSHDEYESFPALSDPPPPRAPTSNRARLAGPFFGPPPAAILAETRHPSRATLVELSITIRASGGSCRTRVGWDVDGKVGRRAAGSPSSSSL